MAVSKQHSWQELKSQQTKEAILEATYKCFAKYGYANTTTPRIADMAKISRGAMTHHYKSRIDVIQAGVERLYRSRIAEYNALMANAAKNTLAYEGDVERVGDEADAETFVPVRAAMHEIVRAISQYFSLPSYFVHLDLIVASGSDQQLAVIIEQLSEKAEEEVSSLFKKLFPLKSAADENIDFIFDLLFFTLRGMNISYVNAHKTQRIEKMLSHLTDDCMGILFPRSAR